MAQTNLITNKVRQIQQKQQILTVQPNQQKQINIIPTNYWIRGLLGDIELVQKELQEELSNQSAHDELKIPENLIAGLSSMIKRLNHPPKLSVNSEHGTIIFVGNQYLIKMAKLEIMNCIDLNYSQYQIQFPTGFEALPHQNIQKLILSFLLQLNVTQPRYQKLKKLLIKIFTNVWQRFYYDKLMLRDKIGKENSQYLFHGTRNNHPSIIYKGADEAFDMRLANQGLWGRGIYFAQLAQYSNSYSYIDNKTQIRQMFLAEVNLGASIKLKEDGDLRRPPEKNKAGQRYDSVEGYTGNSVVFIVYDNSKAYPSFLISYKI